MARAGRTCTLEQYKPGTYLERWELETYGRRYVLRPGASCRWMVTEYGHPVTAGDNFEELVTRLVKRSKRDAEEKPRWTTKEN